MIFDARLADAWARLPDYLGGHALVSLAALAIGLGISLPVAIASRRGPVLRGTLLTIASIVQTIPGLALLALFYPLLLALAALSERMTGKSFSALGFLPSVLALALYSMLPVLRNTVTGLNGVDRRLSEAARVVGVPPWKLLRDIELPLALPVIMAGIRTSAVWVIGTATLATPIGQTSLAIRFSPACRPRTGICHLRLRCRRAPRARGGSIASTDTGGRDRRSVANGARRIWPGALTLAALLPGLARPQATYVIGAKTFTEQYVLAAANLSAPRSRRPHGLAPAGAWLQRAV